MKILLISNKSPWPPKDGGSSATLSMIYGLKLKGASVTVLALNTFKHHVDINSVPADLAGDFHLVDLDSGLKPIRFLLNFLFTDQPYNLMRFESEEFKKRISEIISDSYDIIQVEGLAMACYVDFIRSCTTAKIVYRSHNVESIIWDHLSEEEKNLYKRIYYRVLASRIRKTETGIMNRFDAIVPMTGNDLDWFANSGLSIPHLVTPPGFPPPSPSPSEAGNLAFSVYYIGALDWHPNIKGLRWFIIKVWPKVTDSIPEASFHIAGRNPSASVVKMCRGKGVVFNGEVASSADFSKNKAVMVAPLFSGSGIRMKILEGMQMGKTIVATSAAAEGLIYKNSKDIFIADDPATFAGYLIMLLKDENLRIKTGLNAVENVRKNYNILVLTENLLKFYSQLH